MKKYYETLDWEKIKRNEVQEKYDIFMEVYERGIQKNVPSYKAIEKESKIGLM